MLAVLVGKPVNGHQSRCFCPLISHSTDPYLDENCVDICYCCFCYVLVSSKATLYGTPKIPVFYELMTIIAMCAFMMFGGILLMNLLIAVFG